MSEKLKDIDVYHDLIDISEEVREQFRLARESKERRTSQPDGLYIELPGHTINYEVRESDCGGYWTEQRTFTLENQPYPLISVDTGLGDVRVSIGRDVESQYGFDTRLSPDELHRGNFYLKEKDDFDARLNEKFAPISPRSRLFGSTRPTSTRLGDGNTARGPFGVSAFFTHLNDR